MCEGPLRKNPENNLLIIGTSIFMAPCTMAWHRTHLREVLAIRPLSTFTIWRALALNSVFVGNDIVKNSS